MTAEVLSADGVDRDTIAGSWIGATEGAGCLKSGTFAADERKRGVSFDGRYSRIAQNGPSYPGGLFLRRTSFVHVCAESVDSSEENPVCIVARWVSVAIDTGRRQDALSWLRVLRAMCGPLPAPLAELENRLLGEVATAARAHDDRRHHRRPTRPLLSRQLAVSRHQFDVPDRLIEPPSLLAPIRARGRQCALDAGLIAHIPTADIITYAGRAALAAVAVPGPVSATALLSTLAEHDQFGGCSMELFAWELNAAPSLVAAAWFAAQRAGLLDFVGVDPQTGEHTYQLNARGWALYGCDLLT